MNPSGQAAAKLAAIPLYVHGEGTREMTQDPAQDWHKVCALAEIPPLGARVVKRAHGDIAAHRLWRMPVRPLCVTDYLDRRARIQR